MKPELSIKSDLGTRISSGLRTALFNELDVQKQSLALKADKFAADEIRDVQTQLSGKYKQLLGEHADLMEHIELVKSIVPTGPGGLKSLRPADIIRNVSQNQVIREKVVGKLEDKYGSKLQKEVGGLQKKIGSELGRQLGQFGGLLGGLPRTASRPPTVGNTRAPASQSRIPQTAQEQLGVKVRQELQNRLNLNRFGGLGGFLPTGTMPAK